MNELTAGAASHQPYPVLTPYESGMLDVGDGHEIYWEVCGNPQGRPALFVHGGPGGGCSPEHRRLFDPSIYRIILFDQRGCGRSRPTALLTANTTQHLLADMERLRVMLGVERWLLLGGSWGATLALLYAQTYPQHVSAMVLRGVFTARLSEVNWLYQHGASVLFPEGWEKFIAPIPEAERNTMVAAYHKRLTCGDLPQEMEAARTWCNWEAELMTLLPRNRGGMTSVFSPHTRALAQIEAHYFIHDSFIGEGQILNNVHLLDTIPAIIVQGRYDVVTPPTTAYALHRAWPNSRLDIVPDAGHATGEPGTTRRLIAATDELAIRAQWSRA